MSEVPSEIPVLLKRRLLAQVIGPIHAEMVAALGKEKADAILDVAIRKAAVVVDDGDVVAGGRDHLGRLHPALRAVDRRRRA